MKVFLLISLIFCCNFTFANCPYQNYVKSIWDTLPQERKTLDTLGFLPENIEDYLSSHSHLEAGERLFLVFYPLGCGFDYLMNETAQLTDVKNFFEIVRKQGFKVIFCCPYRHLAEFEDLMHLKEFIHTTFHTNLNREEPPLRFPAKIMVAELEKM